MHLDEQRAVRPVDAHVLELEVFARLEDGGPTLRVRGSDVLLQHRRPCLHRHRPQAKPSSCEARPARR